MPRALSWSYVSDQNDIGGTTALQAHELGLGGAWQGWTVTRIIGQISVAYYGSTDRPLAGRVFWGINRVSDTTDASPSSARGTEDEWLGWGVLGFYRMTWPQIDSFFRYPAWVDTHHLDLRGQHIAPTNQGPWLVFRATTSLTDHVFVTWWFRTGYLAPP